MSTFAANLITGENVQVAASKVREVKNAAKDGDFSLKLLAFLGGVAVVVTGSLELASNFVSFDLIKSLMNLYVILMGLVILVLEGRQIMLPDRIILRLHKYALFLKFLWGRGLLFFVTGSLLLTEGNLLGFVVGGYMCFVGILYVVVGHRAAAKLKEIRRTLFSEQALRSKFNEANDDGTGLLTLKQFRNLIQSLGMDMTRRETEAAFFHLNKVDTGKLDYEEFRSWWVNCDEETLDSTSSVPDLI